MKEYRLAAWPELAPPYDRTAYRRLLNEISLRHMSLRQLTGTGGLRRHEVRQFLGWLAVRGLVDARPLGLWAVCRAWAASGVRRVRRAKLLSPRRSV